MAARTYRIVLQPRANSVERPLAIITARTLPFPIHLKLWFLCFVFRFFSILTWAPTPRRHFRLHIRQTNLNIRRFVIRPFFNWW